MHKLSSVAGGGCPVQSQRLQGAYVANVQPLSMPLHL